MRLLMGAAVAARGKGHACKPARLKVGLLATAAVTTVALASPARAEVCDSGTEIVDGDGSGTRPSPWNTSGALVIARDGTCELIVRNGGEVSTPWNLGHMYVGQNEGSDGAVTITGDGSAIRLTNISLFVGSRGQGELTVDNGGLLELDSNGTIYVGTYGTATMTIVGGGQVQSRGGHIGQHAGSAGAASVSGTGSAWNLFTGLIVGGQFGGSGTLTITDGGAVTADQGVQIGAWGTGAVTVTGQGSSLIAGSDVMVGQGDGGTGELTVSNGATVTSHRAHVGYPGASGSVTVTGAGSVWTLGDMITLGAQNGGTGEMLIADGGVVRMSESNFSKSVRIGSGNGAWGRLALTGAGSLLSFDGPLYVGYSETSEGELSIANGARVESGVGAIGGYYANSLASGVVSVTGAGSVWSSSGYIHLRQLGRLTVSDGGQIHSRGGFVGDGPAEDGNLALAIVTGAGSAWTISNGLVVGIEGAGMLLVSEGGAIRVGDAGNNTVEIARGNNSVGHLFIGGGDGEAPSDAGFEAGRIAFGRGEGRLVFNYTGAGIDIDSAISGVGLIEHRAGTTTFSGISEGSNFFQGETRLTGGSLDVDGVFGRASHVMTVSDGATLGGSGTIGGTVTVADATLAPGSSPGTLTIDGDLVLGSASILDFELGDPSGTAGVDSDLINVVGSGNLTLDGTLNVIDAGGFGAGLYRLINYDGALTDNGLEIGTAPAGFDTSDLTVQTSVANQVNLLVDAPAPTSFFFWDGPNTSTNDAADGGTASWTATGTNWTVADGSANGAFDPAELLIFAGTPGTVTVEDGAGAIEIAAGMQFAVDGYTVTGGDIGLDGATVVRVGDGTNAGGDFTATIASSLTGTGSLEKTDLGTLVLSGQNAYTGGTTVTAGTLIGNATSLQGDIANDAALVFDQSEDGSYAGSISGSGALAKQGAGTLALTGDSGGFLGVTELAGGALMLNGALGGTLRVNDATWLGGTGSAGFVEVLFGGTVAPGGSIGTLEVAGIAFGAGSVFEVELNDGGFTAGTSNDLIASSGPVFIDGGTVHVTPENGTDTGQTYTPGTYTILTGAAAGDDAGVNGVFDGVTDDFAFLHFALSYDPASVFLTSSLARTSFCLEGMTSNQCSAGEGAFSLGGGELFDALLVLTDAEAPAALDRLSGELHASAQTALIEDSRFPRKAALDRLATVGEAENGAWGRAFGSWGDWKGDGNAADFDRSIGGFFVGGDAVAGENVRLGVFGGYSHASFDLQARGSHGSADSWHLGAYGGGQWGALALLVGGAYAWHDVETSRAVSFTGFSDNISAAYDARTGQVFGELGYRIEHGAASFEPFANLAYVHFDGGDYTETGGAAALAGAAEGVGGTFSTLGLRAEGQFGLGEAAVTIQGTAGWRHAFGDLDPLAAHSFAGSDSFSVAGVPVSEDVLVLDFGISARLGPGASLRVSYDGQHGSGVSDHGLTANFGIVF